MHREHTVLRDLYTRESFESCRQAKTVALRELETDSHKRPFVRDAAGASTVLRGKQNHILSYGLLITNRCRAPLSNTTLAA
jgi:hypothetical protein